MITSEWKTNEQQQQQKSGTKRLLVCGVSITISICDECVETVNWACRMHSNYVKINNENDKIRTKFFFSAASFCFTYIGMRLTHLRCLSFYYYLVNKREKWCFDGKLIYCYCFQYVTFTSCINQFDENVMKTIMPLATLISLWIFKSKNIWYIFSYFLKLYFVSLFTRLSLPYLPKYWKNVMRKCLPFPIKWTYRGKFGIFGRV